MYEATFGPLENSTGRTLGWPYVCYFDRELVADLSYKYPYPLPIFHSFQTPLGCQSVLRVFCEPWWSVRVFRSIREAELLQFYFKEVTFDP